MSKFTWIETDPNPNVPTKYYVEADGVVTGCRVCGREFDRPVSGAIVYNPWGSTLLPVGARCQTCLNEFGIKPTTLREATLAAGARGEI